MCRFEDGELVHAPQPRKVLLVPQHRERAGHGDEAAEVAYALQLELQVGLMNAQAVDKVKLPPKQSRNREKRCSAREGGRHKLPPAQDLRHAEQRLEAFVRERVARQLAHKVLEADGRERGQQAREDGPAGALVQQQRQIFLEAG